MMQAVECFDCALIHVESRMDSVVCALVVSIIPETEDVKLERVQAGRGHSLSSVPLQNDSRLKGLV